MLLDYDQIHAALPQLYSLFNANVSMPTHYIKTVKNIKPAKHQHVNIVIMSILADVSI